MDASSRTIGLLRTLTSDGLLTGEEVWSLGNFFLKNPECAQTWPGNLLAPMLESAFDDAALSEEEMTLLADTIGSIEQEWRSKNPSAPAPRAADSAHVSAWPALIPVIDAEFEIPAPERESYLVGLKEHSCTCPDWQPRRGLPARHPGKCCKHVAHAFTRTGKVFDPWFQALLDDCFAKGRGTNPAINWMLFDLPTKPALVGGGVGPWFNVYAESENGYEPFAFNAADNRWSFDAHPMAAPAIERGIREKFQAA